jgi:hypothetical protein
MALKSIRFERTGNRQIDNLQRELNGALGTLLGSPFATGHAIRSLSIGTSATVVLHGLGVSLTNWVVLRFVSAIGVGTTPSLWEVTQSGSLYATQIQLQASRPSVVDIWVS